MEGGGSMSKRVDRVGERFTNTKGEEFVIVEYNKRSDVWVQFLDEYKAKVHTQYGCCKNGVVRNPYHKSVYGVGCLGLMSDGSKPKTKRDGKMSREYTMWNNMIGRAYSPTWHDEHPSYIDTEVCDRWKCFASFLEDLPLIEGYDLWLNHPDEGVALDKDIKGEGSKLYSLETCCFVSRADNAKEMVGRYNTSKKVYGIHTVTGEQTKTYNSVKEVGRELGFNHTNVHACLRGRQKSCGGYYWFEAEE